MTFFCVLAVILFFFSVSVMASMVALVTFVFGVFSIAIALLLFHSTFISSLLMLAYAGFAVIMLLFINDRKSTAKKYLIIAIAPCLYFAYKIYSSCSFENRTGLMSDYKGICCNLFANYNELLCIAVVILLCGIFCASLSTRTKHDFKNPFEDD